ncbi:MAG: hypothetical protein RL685_1105 [Pseudomonadota bacterium]|jgi:hypothetical protein
MKTNSNDSVSLRFAPLAALLSVGCLMPPPLPAEGAAAPAAAASTGAPAAAATAAASPSGSGKEVIWDGDDVTRGQGWASCDKEAEGCKSQLAPAPGEGAKGSSGLKLHGEGTGWQGGGWNWFGWWPENAGTDLTGYDELAFSVKVTAAKDKAPTPGGINLTFGCSKDKKNSADAALGKYAADATDGAWHDVRIPLQDFFAGKGAECDPRTAWELRVSSWSGTPVHFDLVLDNITVEKRATN